MMKNLSNITMKKWKKCSITYRILLIYGKTYIYKVYSLEYIKPSQIEKIDTNKKNTITLFTCDGWFDEKRLVVKADII